MKQKGLGRGLEALLSVSNVLPTKNSQESISVQEEYHDSLTELSIDKINIGKYQPRKFFDKKDLEDLAESIKHNGIIQPLVVRKVKGEYELIAGERRLRASTIVGLKKVPVVIKKFSDKEALAIALVENIQRKDLNVIEEAESYKRLITEFKLTHEEVSRATGKSRSHITNILRLLNLDQEIIILLLEGEIDMGHARALLSLPANLQVTLASEIIKHNLTTAEVEKRVANLLNGTIKDIIPTKSITPELSKLEIKFAKKIGMPVKIKQNPKGKGQITINYDSVEKLNKLLDFFN